MHCQHNVEPLFLFFSDKQDLSKNAIRRVRELVSNTSARTLETSHAPPRTLPKIGQVEVDAPGGESLAFTLRHGEEDGIAVVDFCRENEKVFPDEQECVVTLMQEISSS